MKKLIPSSAHKVVARYHSRSAWPLSMWCLAIYPANWDTWHLAVYSARGAVGALFTDATAIAVQLAPKFVLSSGCG